MRNNINIQYVCIAVLLSYGHLFIVDVRPTFGQRKFCFPLKIWSFIHNMHFLQLAKILFRVIVGQFCRYAVTVPFFAWLDVLVCPCSTVLLHNALPFVGFGFLDNCIMIVAVSLSACCSVAGLGCSHATRHLLCAVIANILHCRHIWNEPLRRGAQVNLYVLLPNCSLCVSIFSLKMI